MAGVEVVRPTFPTNIPTISGVDSSNVTADFNNEVQSILGTIPAAPPITAQPYITGSDSSPKLPIRHNFEMSNQDRQPVNNSVQERKMARQQNTAAALGNTVKSFINRHEEKKQTELTSEITTVMKAQQQIQNAQSILASDPNNALAKNVLQRNMQVIESKLSNDKLRKQFEKAFDVSFIDPSKNDTPEIKALQNATKQVKAANAAGTIADTPEEKALQQMHENGGNPPPVQQAQATATKAPITNGGTPYAKQFIDSQALSISPNPEYQSQLKARELYDQKITQYVVPKLLQAGADKFKALLREGNENARAQFKGVIDYQKSLNKLLNDSNIADAKNATALKAQSMKDATAMAQTMLRVNAAMLNAEAKGIKGTPLAKKMQDASMKLLTTQIGQVDKDNTELAAQLSIAEKAGNKEQIDYIQHSISMNKLKRDQLADESQKLMIRIYGTPQGGPIDTRGNAGYTKDGGKSADTANNTNESTDKSEQAGKLLSDSDSSTDDSAEDDAVNAYNIYQ